MLATSMVSARIPLELRKQGDAILAESGQSPSKLIQAAYDYLVKTGEIPVAPAPPAAKNRSLLPDQVTKLKDSINATTVRVPSSYFQGKSDDELLAEALRGKYEGLA